MDEHIQNLHAEVIEARNAAQGLIADHLLDPDNSISERTRALLMLADQALETQTSVMDFLLARIEALNKK